MSSDKPSTFKGFLAKRPLLVFVWSVAPIVLIIVFRVLTINMEYESAVAYGSIYSIGLQEILSSLSIFILPALLISFAYATKLFDFLKLSKKPKLRDILISTLLVFAANTFLGYLIELNSFISLSEGLSTKLQNLQELAKQAQSFFLDFQNGGEFIIVFLVLAILPALAEELYFRGLLMGLLRDIKLSGFWLVLIPALLFAMMHLQFYYLLPLLFMGALLGYVFYRTKNLWVSMYMHLLNNGMIVLITLNNKKGLTSIDLESNPPAWLSMIGIVIFALGLYSLHKQTKASS